MYHSSEISLSDAVILSGIRATPPSLRKSYIHYLDRIKDERVLKKAKELINYKDLINKEVLELKKKIAKLESLL